MKMSSYRLRVVRKVAIFLAMAPMFQQIGWCGTAVNRTVVNTLNGAPATYSSTLQGIALIPFNLLIDFIFGNNAINGGV